MGKSEQVFAQGESAGTAWTLGWEGDDTGGVTWLRLTTPDGSTHKGGYGSESLDPGVPVSLYTGSSDRTPNGAILRVPRDVTAMQVATSDGVIQTVRLVRHPAHQNALVGALVYPQGTQITSMTVADATGPHEVAMTRPKCDVRRRPPAGCLPDMPR